jgi:stearoyl-CoA desaturase (Delta-9 desaturase)
MLPLTGIQASESITLIKLRVVIVYVGCLAAWWVPLNWELLLLAALSFYLRTFGWEGGHHRYFAHRSFKTGRIFQTVLACLGASSGQRGPLWWACHHRAHHRYSDTPRDPHTPVGKGRLYAYLGWIFDKQYCDTDLDEAKDFAKYPELVWINKYHYVFPYLLLAGLYALGRWTTLLGYDAGLAAVVWGFFVPTFVSLQGSLLVNAFAHGYSQDAKGWFSYRSYRTSDTSRNNWLLSFISLGASWHNNHHRYMNSATTGFRWWELDITYLTLRVLAMLGLVWDLHRVPPHIRNEQKLIADN